MRRQPGVSGKVIFLKLFTCEPYIFIMIDLALQLFKISRCVATLLAHLGDALAPKYKSDVRSNESLPTFSYSELNIIYSVY